MISAITAEPAVSGIANLTDYRSRAPTGERTLLPDSAPAAPKNSKPGDDARYGNERQAPPQPEPPRKDSSSMFAAAVIAGRLSPTPQSMEELMIRIGTSTIPEESEARLRDLVV